MSGTNLLKASFYVIGINSRKSSQDQFMYLLVVDWLEVDEVAAEDEVHVDPGDDQYLIARQCITGLTSRQNSG